MERQLGVKHRRLPLVVLGGLAEIKTKEGLTPKCHPKKKGEEGRKKLGFLKVINYA